jgi:hypothetical protein
MKTPIHRSAAVVAAVATAGLLLTACASTPATPPESAEPEAEASGRVALTYDGGIYLLDAASLELEADITLSGFNRLNPAGDGTSVLVSTSTGFRVLDTVSAELTALEFDAPTPGHVVRHGDKTILFSDGTGDAIIYDSASLLATKGELPETEVVASETAHHGVAIELEDGTLLSTLGDSESRSGVRALDAGREEFLRSEDCPSVHGEGAAENEVAVFGCSDGVLVYDDGEFTKIAAEDVYGRTGNQYVSETSTLTVGDYNSDPDSEGYLLSELVITDTAAKASRVVDLPDGVEYTWRGVARGPDDLAYVLAADGAIHVLDPETGELGESFPVIEAWEGPAEWQDAHPALVVVDGIGYVTEPASNGIHVVDLATGEVVASATLDATPNEIAVVG